MRVLNLYAGLGGNRKLWDGVEVTAIEMNPHIADVYQAQNPDDEIIIDDAHQYLLDHFEEFDFIWSSPPCQSHSMMIRSGRNRQPRYPDMKLYEEVLFLKHNFKGKWVVENVRPYYEPLLAPFSIGRHLFWSNFPIWKPTHEPKFENFITASGKDDIYRLKKWLGIEYDGNIYYGANHDPGQVLRNCVHPIIGRHVFDCFLSEKGEQMELV